MYVFIVPRSSSDCTRDQRGFEQRKIEGYLNSDVDPGALGICEAFEGKAFSKRFALLCDPIIWLGKF